MADLEYFDRLCKIMNINESKLTSLKSLDFIAYFNNKLCYKVFIYNMYM